MNSTSSSPVNTDYNYGQYDNTNPTDLQTAETINVTIVVDMSPSVRTYVDELTTTYNDFIKEMQESHVAEKLMVSKVEFNDIVVSRTGFQPIADVQRVDFSQNVGGKGTALYGAVLDGLENAINYRTASEVAGVGCKTLIIAITDGQNNIGDNIGPKVKAKVDELLRDERGFGSFVTILFGVGTDRPSFEHAQTVMGFQNLGVVGTTMKELRKMIDFISQSISSTAAGQMVSSPNF